MTMTDREKFEAWFTTVSAGDIAGWAKHGMWQAWQAALASQQPADDAWIKWAGGDCPVDGDSLVNVKYELGGEDMESRPAKIYDWSSNKDFCYPIIAYRVVKS